MRKEWQQRLVMFFTPWKYKKALLWNKNAAFPHPSPIVLTQLYFLNGFLWRKTKKKIKKFCFVQILGQWSSWRRIDKPMFFSTRALVGECSKHSESQNQITKYSSLNIGFTILELYRKLSSVALKLANTWGVSEPAYRPCSHTSVNWIISEQKQQQHFFGPLIKRKRKAWWLFQKQMESFQRDIK